MVRTLLITIVSDPAESPRPAEAVRIAAGLGAWRKVQVHLYFKGPAVKALDEFADELSSGELFAQYLPTVPEHGGKIIVDTANPRLASLNPAIPFEAMTSEQIQKLASEVDHGMEF
jgi:hypothetical protein